MKSNSSKSIKELSKPIPTGDLMKGLLKFYSPTTSRHIIRVLAGFNYKMRYQQIRYLKMTTIELDDLRPVTCIKLGDICNLKPQIITKALKKFSKHRNPIGNKKKLTDEQEETVIQHICAKCNDHMPLSSKEILDFCLKQLKIELTDGWLQKFIKRHSNRIQRAVSYPQ